MAMSRDKPDRIESLAKSYDAMRLSLFGSSAEVLNTTNDFDCACDGAPGWKW